MLVSNKSIKNTSWVQNRFTTPKCLINTNVQLIIISINFKSLIMIMNPIRGIIYYDLILFYLRFYNKLAVNYKYFLVNNLYTSIHLCARLRFILHSACINYSTSFVVWGDGLRFHMYTLLQY